MIDCVVVVNSVLACIGNLNINPFKNCELNWTEQIGAKLNTVLVACRELHVVNSVMYWLVLAT